MNIHLKTNKYILWVILLFMYLTPASAEDKFSITQHKGQVVYLDFWASWCIPCRNSFPWMNEMHEKYHEDGLKIIAINVDEDIEMRTKFLEQYPAQFEVYFNPSGNLAEKYEIIGMPSSVIIGRDGEIIAQHVGFRDSEIESYEDEIKKHLFQGQVND